MCVPFWCWCRKIGQEPLQLPNRGCEAIICLYGGGQRSTQLGQMRMMRLARGHKFGVTVTNAFFH
jgi:hypothetical protein